MLLLASYGQLFQICDNFSRVSTAYVDTSSRWLKILNKFTIPTMSRYIDVGDVFLIEITH